MALFTFEVTETRVTDRIYVVEAASQNEAMAKAQTGDIIEERDIDEGEISISFRTCAAHDPGVELS